MAYTKKNALTKRPLGEGRKDQFDLDMSNNTIRNRADQPSLQDRRHGAPTNHAGYRLPSRPENGCQPAASHSDRRAASMSNRDVAKAAHLLTRQTGFLENLLRRVIQDACQEARADYWDRRAEEFERARPKPGDRTGRATPEQIAEQDRRMAATAEACRQRAQLIRAGAFDDEWAQLIRDEWAQLIRAGGLRR